MLKILVEGVSQIYISTILKPFNAKMAVGAAAGFAVIILMVIFGRIKKKIYAAVEFCNLPP